MPKDHHPLITVIHVRVSNYAGGIETSLLGWLRAMDSSRFRARLFVFEEGNRSHERSAGIFREHGLKVEFLPWGRFKNIPGAVRRLVAAVREQPNTIVQSHDTRSDLVALLAARICKVPVVISNHAWHPVDTKRRLLEALRARLMRGADIVINVSEDTHQQTLERGIPKEKSATIYSGIDLAPYQQAPSRGAARAKLGMEADAFAVGNVARMWPEKAQHTLIDAVSRLAPRHPEVRVLLVGDGPLEGELRAQAEALGVTDRVSFLGFRKDFIDVMAAMDVFALPSTAEGTPMVIYGAMAMGLPIIGSAVSGVGEILDDEETAILIPPADTDALTVAIERLINDPQLAERLGRNARRAAVQRYSVEQAIGRFEQIYAALNAGLPLPV